MQNGDDRQQAIADKLRQAIDTLRADTVRVELWASALGCFALPIPDYDFEHKYRLKDRPKPGTPRG